MPLTKRVILNFSSTGIFSRIYKWLWGSRSTWFGGMWFEEPQAKQSTTTTTTPVPLTTSSSNWFQTLLDSEENDDASTLSQSGKFTSI